MICPVLRSASSVALAAARLFSLLSWRFAASARSRSRENFAVVSALRELATYDSAVHDFFTADLEEFDNAVRATLVDQQRSGVTPVDLVPSAASRIIV